MNRRLFALILIGPGLTLAASGVSTPRKSPALMIDMMNGSKLDIAHYPGKVVVFVAIMTSCPHCQAATRTLAALQKEFGPRGLQVLEAAIDTTPATAVPWFIKNYNPPFPVGAVDYREAIKYMGLDVNKQHYVPFVTFIDRRGMIRGQYAGNDPFNAEDKQAANLRNLAAKLIAEDEESAHK